MNRHSLEVQRTTREAGIHSTGLFHSEYLTATRPREDQETSGAQRSGRAFPLFNCNQCNRYWRP